MACQAPRTKVTEKEHGQAFFCYGWIWRCNKCGNIGCSRDGCSTQRFYNGGRCMCCGAFPGDTKCLY